jgi:Na+/H+-dicarboxylate symporter
MAADEPRTSLSGKALARLSVNEIADEARKSIDQSRDFAVDNKTGKAQPASGCCGKICACWDYIGLTFQTLGGVILGFCIALILRESLGEIDSGGTLVRLIAYPGDLFVSALKLIVVPMIATGMILAIINLGDLSKIKFIGGRALVYYLSTTFFAAAEGLIWVNIFQPGVGAEGEACGVGDSDVPTYTSKPTEDAFLDVGRSMLPSNLIEAFLTTNILGIICFSLMFGFYLNKDEDEAKKKVVLQFFDACNTALMSMVTMIIAFTPLGIMSLVMAEVVKQNNLGCMLSALAAFVGCTVLGLFIHAAVVYPSIYMFMTKKNPLVVFRGIVQPCLTAFATSSSAATLPVTIKASEALGVDQEIARFVLPLGATVNMDGTAVYFPIAVIFLANFQGVYLNFGSQVAIAFVSSFVSIGAAPIPNAGLVYLILIMSAVNVPIAPSISFVLAIDWFLDRCQTCVNVTGDSFGAVMFHELRKKAEANKKPVLN